MKPKDDRKIEQLFSATLRLVSRVGLAGITMADIAKEAGLGTGTVYVYFKSKDELINALYVQCKEAAVGDYLAGYDPTESYRIGLKRVWLNILKHRLEHRQEAIFVEQCYYSPFISAENRSRADQLLEPLLGLVERGKHEQRIKDEDSFILLTYLVGPIVQLVDLHHYSNRPLRQEDIDASFKLCWDGLKA